jgi:hypothetical protein
MNSNNNQNLQAAPVATVNASAQVAKAEQPKSNPNSTQNTLLIAEVRDGIVIMNDGTFRAVIMCKSINFDLMSPQEREAVEFSYQGFLNSQQTNIMDKKFYVVISYPDPDEDIKSALKQSTGFFTGVVDMFSKNKTPHVTIDETRLEQAKTELKHRVESVMAGLLESGIQSIPLDTQELIELYYDVYNPDTATRQQLKHFDDLNTPVVTKGEGDAPQPNLDKEQS